MIFPSISNPASLLNWGISGLDASAKPTTMEKVKDFATSVTPVLGTVKATVEASKMDYQLQFSSGN